MGTFQFYAARKDTDALRALSDYVIDRHYPLAAQQEQPYRALLDAVVAAQARLVARWMLVGFIHGVMNTDNMSIAGETIDYGPCAFMDAYHPGMVFSSIDQAGRYAYGNQPRAAHWNPHTLCPSTSADHWKVEKTTRSRPAQDAVDAFPGLYQSEWFAGHVPQTGPTRGSRQRPRTRGRSATHDGRQRRRFHTDLSPAS